MKQKLYLAIAFLLASFCSLHMQAERVAPTLPQGQTPEEGKCYWLYNVATGLFMGDEYAGSSSQTGTLDGTDVYLEKSGDYWVLRKNSPEGYWLYSYASNSYNSYFTEGWGHVESSGFYVITESNSSYKIQVQPNESSDLYLGYNPETKNLNPRYTENVDWLFMDASEAAHYTAELKLYNALNATDGKGWWLDQYETMYANRAEATNLEMSQAAELLTQALENSKYSGVFDPLNEYDMMFYYSANGYDKSKFQNDEFYMNMYRGTLGTLTAVVDIDHDGELFYTPRGGNNSVLVKVYIDDVLVRTISPRLLDRLGNSKKIFEKITAGKHIVRWVFNNTQEDNGYYDYGNSITMTKIGIAKNPLITVHLAEPGSLGTEVLYNVNHVRDVRNLKVIGNMNSEDATRLSMMTNLISLDLSEATLAELPNRTFYIDNAPYLHNVVLPEGMTTIGDEAFLNSNVETVVLPSTLKNIGYGAFSSTMIKTANIPDATINLGSNAFDYCYQLETVNYSKNLTVIPYKCFQYDNGLRTINIPEGVTVIEAYAFDGCDNVGEGGLELPMSLRSIGESAFEGCFVNLKEIVLKDNVTEIGRYAFSRCTGLEKAVVSQHIFTLNRSSIFSGCEKLKDLTMRSATLVKPYNAITDDEYRPNITLRVPQHLVNYYKLDPYWYNFGDIVGFSTADTKDWTVHADLTLDSHSRFEGEPNIDLKEVNLKIVGDLPMTIDNFSTTTNWGYGYEIDNSSQIMSGCDNITVLGSWYHNTKMLGQRWLCMTLPFDTKLGNIVPVTDDVLFSVRYYDGAERAENGVGGSWKRISDSEQVIPAGTGFIIQNSAAYYDDAIVQFQSLANDSRNNALNNKDFEKTLEINASAEKSNRGWNLVGNPYLTYYNIHKLNFVAPITVYDYYSDKYNAYSIADDDYALMPLQGFFVQCPGEEMNTISFPVSGKQFTSEITEQNAVKARVAGQNSRKLIDLTLSKGDIMDNTRIVFNKNASCNYEISCDASKFMSGNKKNIQLWTLDEKGTAYAINERPMVDGVVALGVTIPSSGTYTFAATRCQAEGIVLHDNETGIDTDLTQSEYTFEGSEGTFANRFEIRTVSADATGIDNIADSDIDGVKIIYTVDGRLVKKADKSFNEQSLPQGAYIIKTNGTTKKVIINK